MALWPLCTWAHDVHDEPYICAGVHELPQSHCGDNRGGHIVFMITYILGSSYFCEIWALCSYNTVSTNYFCPEASSG